jgi:lipid-binding SYLF domain-containing protein
MKGNTMKDQLRKFGMFAAVAAAMVIVAGCAKPKGETGEEKRGYVDQMAASTLDMLADKNPGVKSELENAAGFAVLETVQTQIIITTSGNGFGLARNNRTGKEFYMSTFQLGAGLGAGIKASKVITVFETEDVFNKFVHEGWTFDASGSATAKAVNLEGDAVGQHEFVNGIKTYVYTENGLMAGVALRGSKVWLNKDLN